MVYEHRYFQIVALADAGQKFVCKDCVVKLS